MEQQPILVLGATGTTGRRVAGRLRAAGFAVRAASRRGEVRFDWSDPGSWEPAVAGTARMYLMAPHELPVDPSFVRCAVEAGVRHIVLLSSRGIEAMGDERLMAAALTEDGHAGQRYELTGPRALSFGEALEIIGRASGRSVRFRGTAEDYLAAQAALGAPVEQAQQEVEAFARLRELGDARPTGAVRRVTGREPKDFERYAAEAAAAGAWRG
jgi:uncharacterized protein YbjT (DUF2867 family)